MAVTCILRQAQAIRLGTIHIKNQGLQVIKNISKVPVELSAQVDKLKLFHLHLFGASFAWAEIAESIQP